MWDALIIGGGAAGLSCAIHAASQGMSILLLERMDRIGKKLLATGNGRCNLMNEGQPLYPRNADFAGSVLDGFGAERQKQWWESIGLRLRTEAGGRVYPVTGQASTVLDALRFEAERLGVCIRTGEEVSALKRTEQGFDALTGSGRFSARLAAVMGGGQAQPALGSNGSCYALMERLGHTVATPAPSLCGILTDRRALAGLGGLRARAGVTLCAGAEALYEEAGEVIFAEDSISGVCVMNASAFLREGAVLRLNLLEGMGIPDRGALLREIMDRREKWAKEPLERLMSGLLLPRLSTALLRAAGVGGRDRLSGSLTRQEAERIADAVCGWALPACGTRGFRQAQVTRGGIRVAEIDPESMESRICPGLYAGGEILDVDGLCGGYNLMFAFACGWRAAAHMGGRK